MSMVWLAATKIEPGYTFNAFSNYFRQSSDQRFGFPSNIYYMIVSTRLNDFFAQGRIWFEFAIRISGWARIVSADSFSPIPWFAVRVVTKLAFYIICSVNGANLLLGINANFEFQISVHAAQKVFFCPCFQSSAFKCLKCFAVCFVWVK